MQKIILITTLGATPQRVLKLVYDLMPHRIFLLGSEGDDRWGRENPEFLRDVINTFEKDSLIKAFRDKGKIEDVAVHTISDPNAVFHEVFRICSSFGKDDHVYVDRTGMSATVTVSVQNVACCFRHVTVVYESSKSPQKYSTKIYGTDIAELGDKMVEIPIPRVDLKKITADGFPRQVFRACYDLAKEKRNSGGEPIFQSKEAFQKFEKKDEPSKNLRIKVTQNLNSFFSDGFLDEEPLTGRAFKMTPFALSLGEELFEEKRRYALPSSKSDQPKKERKGGLSK